MNNDLFARVTPLEAEVLAYRWADRAVRRNLPLFLSSVKLPEEGQRIAELPEFARPADLDKAITALHDVARRIAEQPEAAPDINADWALDLTKLTRKAVGFDRRMQSWAITLLARVLQQLLQPSLPEFKKFALAMGTFATISGVGDEEGKKQLADLVTITSNRVKE
jgi:hypothetical protein